VNANDDVVRVARLAAIVGQAVVAGQLLAEVETDKSVVEVLSEMEGRVLRVDAGEGETIASGAILLWLGDSPNDSAPATTSAALAGLRSLHEPTAKARQLLALYGLDATQIRASGTRLSADDVECYVATRSLAPNARAPSPESPASEPQRPQTDGMRQPLTPAERAMVKTVEWHGSVAVPGYLEVPFDHAAWRAYADDFANERKLLMDPLLALVAFRLVAVANEVPAINATLLGHERFVFASVNLGFTVKTKSNLVMVTLRDASRLDEPGFVRALGRLQRQAFGNRLTSEETTGATLSFSSLANTGVVRHVPVLPPHTSLIVAQSAKPAEGPGIIGATFDHRILDGDTVARALQNLSVPQHFRQQLPKHLETLSP
jgi:pyruvate/2-oxoglutarate dehydrogenase complex dihydrolipoamide acyltransferase (E2) component